MVPNGGVEEGWTLRTETRFVVREATGIMELYASDGEPVTTIRVNERASMVDEIIEYAERRFHHGMEVGRAEKARDMRRLLEVGEFAPEVPDAP